jgi:integrase
VYIPKPDGKQRPLGVPAIRDRVAQTAAVLVLEPIFEADLQPEQYAYRADRSALDAVRHVHKLLNTGHGQIVDADLSGYFDSIPHADLLKSVARRIVDGAMLQLIKMWLEAPVEETDEKGNTHRSTRNRDEKVDINPAPVVRREKEDPGLVWYLAPDEEKKLRDAIRSKPEWAEHEVEFDLALHTGLRRSSMYIGLVWENVDLDAKSLTIPRASMKNDERITLPLNPDALRALSVFRARGDGRGSVVRNAGGETLIVNADWFPDAVRAAGIPAFRWHDCRHTFSSRLRQKGVDLATIAELLFEANLTPKPYRLRAVFSLQRRKGN